MTSEEDKKKNANNDRKDDDVLFGGVFVTLKILFVDLLVVCLRLSSEVTQGYNLFSDADTRIYGIVTFIIIEIPGIAAAVHVLSVYRENWVWYKTILYAIGSIIFYPLVPILTLLHLLWMTPSEKGIRSNPNFKYFHRLLRLVTGFRLMALMSHAVL